MARRLLEKTSMIDKTAPVNRFKIALLGILAKVKRFFAVPPKLQPVPIPRRSGEKDLERWRNEGGS